MPLSEANFDNEMELQTWMKANITHFFPGSFWINGFHISTISGKQGIPDGFAFNLEDRSWSVVECELLAHGVWPHIAEQLTRFVVAIRNPRNKLRPLLEYRHHPKTNQGSDFSTVQAKLGVPDIREKVAVRVELGLHVFSLSSRSFVVVSYFGAAG